jgi:signal transduction histidine kinase
VVSRRNVDNMMAGLILPATSAVVVVVVVLNTCCSTTVHSLVWNRNVRLHRHQFYIQHQNDRLTRRNVLTQGFGFEHDSNTPPPYGTRKPSQQQQQQQPTTSAYERSPIPVMPSDLFRRMAQSQLELLANSLSRTVGNPTFASTSISPSSTTDIESKVQSMILYLPQENAHSGQLEFTPAVLYPDPNSERVFIASDAESGQAPTLPKTLTKLPGFSHASTLLPGYPMLSPNTDQQLSPDVGAVEEVFCDIRYKTAAALSVPLLSGSQTVGVLLVSPVVGSAGNVIKWTQQDREQVSRAAQSLSMALTMDKERNFLKEQNSAFRENLADSLHQVKNPIQALRTYGKILQRQIAETASNYNTDSSSSSSSSSSSFSSGIGGGTPQLLELAERLMVQSERVVDLLGPMDTLMETLADRPPSTPLFVLPPPPPSLSSSSSILRLQQNQTTLPSQSMVLWQETPSYVNSNWMTTAMMNNNNDTSYILMGTEKDGTVDEYDTTTTNWGRLEPQQLPEEETTKEYGTMGVWSSNSPITSSLPTDDIKNTTAKTRSRRRNNVNNDDDGSISSRIQQQGGSSSSSGIPSSSSSLSSTTIPTTTTTATLVGDRTVEMTFITDVLEPVFETFAAIASECNILFEVMIDDADEIPGVLAAPRSLQEAMSNVLDNAFKYVVLSKVGSPFTYNPNPHVRVRIFSNHNPTKTTKRRGSTKIKQQLQLSNNDDQQPPPGVTILVEDNGPGVLKEERTLIFQRGFRGQQTSFAVPDGRGIGLDISRALMIRMGGSLDVVCDEGINHNNTVPCSDSLPLLNGTVMKFVLFRPLTSSR